MVPRIRSGQECTYEPVTPDMVIRKRDMVYCHVGKYHFTHLVTATRGAGQNTEYQISNNSGHVNGWIRRNRIFGRVTHVEGRPVR